MRKKTIGYHPKETNNEAIDPKLWDRLIWQEALNKAIKRNRDKHTGKQWNN